MKDKIDLDALKKRGFLKAREDGYFTLRTRMLAGNSSAEQLEKLSQISKKYARSFVHFTVRQSVEIPFIRFEDIGKVEKELRLAEIKVGTSGPRLRVTTVCPGNNWCKRGLVNTFSLSERIEKELNIVCGLDLPHKFKIAISGCPNRCTRSESSEIGIHGEIDLNHSEKIVGYAVYLGGCGGRTPRLGFKLGKIFTEDEVLSLIEKVVNFFKDNAKPRQRLALLIEEIGRDNFLDKLGVSNRI
ncbi:MAG: hypothetical protein K9L86_04375 [Candidatus Omnitrophica bacterium]|nr:hypothetical protein [Candidatus Omnitrophota bacterium]